jgi:hypothetical protein
MHARGGLGHRMYVYFVYSFVHNVRHSQPRKDSAGCKPQFFHKNTTKGRRRKIKIKKNVFNMNHVLYIHTNVVLCGRKADEQRKGEKEVKNLKLVFLGYIYGKCHKPCVPTCLRHLNHKRGKDDQKVDYLNLNYGQLQ